MSSLEDTGTRLASYLTEHWQTKVSVDEVRQASAGARRRNILFAAHRGGERLDLVATIVPNDAMLLMDIGVEAENLRLAERAGMPVPHVHAVCNDPEPLGGPFFISSLVEGETIPRRILRLVAANPGLGPTLARQCGAALARLHGVAVAEAHRALVRPQGKSPAAAALERLDTQIGNLLQPSPTFTLAVLWLERHLPDESSRVSVVHGDFRNGNLVIDASGLKAALDWEGCHLGDPMEDLGWVCQRMWRFRNDELEVGGFGDRTDLRAGYVEAGGAWKEESFNWWKVFGTVRWGVGLAGQAAAHLDGSVPSIVMAASGRRVAELEYDTLMLLKRAFD